MNREEILKIVNKHKSELQEKYGVEKIGLFGSIARNEAGKDSDIDIVVELKKADLFILISLKDYLQEKLNGKVDIVRYRADMGTLLKQRINKEVIYV
jgi:predicted nucleotidyltransferase